MAERPPGKPGRPSPDGWYGLSNGERAKRRYRKLRAMGLCTRGNCGTPTKRAMCDRCRASHRLNYYVPVKERP